MKRIVSLILCAVLVLGMVPSIAFAATTVASGTCGDNLTWVLDSDGLLTISGSGAMTDYESSSTVPWYSNRESITDLSLPQGLTSIGNFSFYNVDGLTGITIPDSVAIVGAYAFYDCDNLTTIIIPEGAINIGRYAFCQCQELTDVTISNSVTTIGDCAFSSCDNLTDITIPDSVTSIGNHAFTYCDSLTSVSIGNGVTTIGDGAFGVCLSLTGIWVNESNGYFSSNSSGILFDKRKETLIAFPGGISGTYTIPDSVTTIGEYAFYGCINLTGITIPDSVTSIGNHAFFDCENLTGITIPDSVTSIGNHAFYSCNSLTDITIPDSVTTIGEYAFSFCNSLTDITIPDSVTSIGKHAFIYCFSLTGITIGSGVTTIGEYAFAWCGNRTEVHFKGPAPVFGSSIFANVTASAYYHGTNTTWTSDKLQDYGGTITWTSVDCTRRDYPAVSATCTESGLTAGNACSICGQVFSGRTTIPALGHDWLDASCTVPKTCSICGETSGSALGHSWSAATCTEPKTCTKCNVTSGTALGHSWNAATCTSPKTCSRCSATTGSALGHNYVDGICTRCGTPESGYEPSKPTVDGVYRIAGAGRIETSIGIANALKETLGVEKFSNIVVASALGFPDALAGSYLAAVKDAPILLTYEAVHGQVAQYIAENLQPGGNVYILGGSSAVSSAFEQELSKRDVKYERVSGSDRFGTNMAILNEAGVKSGQTVLVCTAVNFADSLSVSATGMPILLVYGTLRPDQIAYLNRAQPSAIRVIGGTTAVSTALEQALKAYAPDVKRIYGPDRHVTSATVADQFFKDATSAVVAFSRNYPDGLCGGPLAYALGAPLLLTVSGDKTPLAYTSEYGIRTGYVLGSDNLVNDTSVREIFAMSAGAAIPVK